MAAEESAESPATHVPNTALVAFGKRLTETSGEIFRAHISSLICLNDDRLGVLLQLNSEFLLGVQSTDWPTLTLSAGMHHCQN